MATATPLTAVDLASSAVISQQRLLADARRLATKTAEARLDAEHEVAKLVRRETGAVQASAADRANVELAGDLTLARTQLEHARSDLARAVQDDEAASARVKETEARLLEAERALEAAQIEEQLGDGSFESSAAEIAKVIVGSIVSLGDAIARHREMLAREGAAVRHLHQLGAGADMAERDGSCLAGFIASELIAAGGRAAAPITGNAFAIRYELDAPSATETSPSKAVLRLTEIVLASLEQGKRDVAAGAPDRGLGTLRDIESWQRCRSSLDVRALIEVRDHARAQDKATTDRAAHEARLEVSRRKEASMKGRAVMSVAGKDVVIPIRSAPVPVGGEVVAHPGAHVPEIGGEIPPAAAPPSAAASRRDSKPGPSTESIRNPYAPVGAPGDYVLPGSADGPDGNPFPTAPRPGTPAGETNITYSPDKRR